MTLVHAITLGILQGLTEFLPISSSGHLSLYESLLLTGISSQDLMGFDVLLHTGTLGALLVMYRHVWLELIRAPFSRKHAEHPLFILLVIGTIPAAIAGILLRQDLSLIALSPRALAFSFGLTGIILVLAERVARGSGRTHTTLNDALLIGCAQAFALVPGLSRSGLTIATGRSRGMTRRHAVDFSFLLALPAILGATMLISFDVWSGVITLPSLPLTVGGILSSFVSSLLAIYLLRTWVEKYSFTPFALYLFTLSIVLFLAL